LRWVLQIFSRTAQGFEDRQADQQLIGMEVVQRCEPARRRLAVQIQAQPRLDAGEQAIEAVDVDGQRLALGQRRSRAAAQVGQHQQAQGLLRFARLRMA
jgi:hypothetical protein